MNITLGFALKPLASFGLWLGFKFHNLQKGLRGHKQDVPALPREKRNGGTRYEIMFRRF